MQRFLLSCGFWLVCAWPVDAADAPAPGGQTPERAVTRYLLAWETRDRASLRAAVCGRTAEEDHAADVWADSASAQRRVSDSIRKKMSAEEYQRYYGQPMRPKKSLEDVTRETGQTLKDAKVEVAGDEARVTPAGAPPQKAFWLIRRDGEWKVSIAAILRARDADLIQNFISNNWYYGRVYNRLADEIESGILTTADGLNQAIWRVEEAEMKRADPASRPVVMTPEQADRENERMKEREQRRARLEREAAGGPLGQKGP